VIEDGGLVVGLSLSDHDDVVEEHIGIGILGDEQVGGDDVSRREFAEDGGVLQLVGHGHGAHEAGNGLMIHGDFTFGIFGADHFAAEFVGLHMLGRRGARNISEGRMASGEEDRKEYSTGQIRTYHEASLQLLEDGPVAR